MNCARFPSLGHVQTGVPGGKRGRDWTPGPCSSGQCLLASFLFFLKLKYNVHIKNSTYIIHEQLEAFSQTQHQIQQEGCTAPQRHSRRPALPCPSPSAPCAGLLSSYIVFPWGRGQGTLVGRKQKMDFLQRAVILTAGHPETQEEPLLVPRQVWAAPGLFLLLPPVSGPRLRSSSLLYTGLYR